MAQLKNRNKDIPGGFQFRQPQSNFTITAWRSFDSGVKEIIAHRRGNPYITRKHNLATDYQSVANEMDAFNAKICESNGWTEFIVQPASEAPPPKFKALSNFNTKQLSVAADKVKKVWQGVRSLNDWMDSKEPAVDKSLAQKRAEVCVNCPVNGKGGLEEWFTKPASEIIKRQFEKLSERNLKTTVDEKLGVCQACLCPLRLLTHVPLEFKLAHMGAETRKALDSGCWILSEERDRK